jgi:hypothetical protein
VAFRAVFFALRQHAKTPLPKLEGKDKNAHKKEYPVSIAVDLKRKLEQNNHTLNIIEADELIAAWRYRKCNRFTRSVDFTRIPKEWRYSAPPAGCSDVIPCHVSYRTKASHGVGRVDPVCGLSKCHRSNQSWSNRTVPTLAELDAVGFSKRNVAPYISPILDTHTLGIVCKDLGLNGRVATKIIKGRQYVVLSGYSGLRTYLPGTVYSVTNRKIIRMAIGSLGIKNMVKSGAILTIYLTVSLEIFECFLNDEATMYSLIGNITSDLIKIGISSVVAVLLGLAVGTFTSLAFPPIGIAILMGVFTAVVLNGIDDQLKLTDKLIALLEDTGRSISKAAENKIGNAERSLHKGMGGFMRGLTGYRGPF